MQPSWDPPYEFEILWIYDLEEVKARYLAQKKLAEAKEEKDKAARLAEKEAKPAQVLAEKHVLIDELIEIIRDNIRLSRKDGTMHEDTEDFLQKFSAFLKKSLVWEMSQSMLSTDPSEFFSIVPKTIQAVEHFIFWKVSFLSSFLND